VKIYSVLASTDGGWRKNTDAVYLGDLTPNTTYDFKVKARNLYGRETQYYEEEKLTKAAVPGYNSVTEITTTTVKARWQANDNPVETEYLVVASTANDYSIYNSSSGWMSFSGTYEYVLEGLEPNVKYYFGVRARNFAKEETGWCVLDSSYTHIEAVESVEWIVGSSSITVSGKSSVGSGEFSNLTAGDSGIRFFCYSNSAYTDWVSSTAWITQTSTGFTNLTANTTYYFRLVTRNGDGIETTAYKEPKATRIESATGVKFGSINATSIQAAPEGSFSNLTSGQSGVITYCVTTSSNSLWKQTTDWWTLSGLSPNQKYTFKANSRNRAGLENGESCEVSTYTHCNIPLAPTLSNPTTSSINVVINENENPSVTVFAIAVSTDNWNTIKWVGADGKLTDTEVWRTKEQWGGSINGIDITGLSANREYKVKVKARNQCGVETELGPEGVRFRHRVLLPRILEMNGYNF